MTKEKYLEILTEVKKLEGYNDGLDVQEKLQLFVTVIDHINYVEREFNVSEFAKVDEVIDELKECKWLFRENLFPTHHNLPINPYKIKLTEKQRTIINKLPFTPSSFQEYLDAVIQFGTKQTMWNILRKLLPTWDSGLKANSEGTKAKRQLTHTVFKKENKYVRL